MNKSLYHFTILILIAIFLHNSAFAAGTTISGIVKDAKTGEALIGANIVLMGTSMGASSDNNGKYLIPKVVPGTYTLKVSYIGYEESKATINISEGENIKQDFKLEPVGIVGQEVVVTAQAYGQTEAINQQLSSMQIMNVVSSTKIQELPDATVAEAVGRLPGVTVLRSGGEGNEVVIRGLAPKYNKILIDGIELSSSNPNDRSADLSNISSNMLDGIQVTKSVTADMDAEVVGGTINFQLREARLGALGKPTFNILTQGGYNNLSNAPNKYNNYKYVGSVEDRFFDELLGVFAQVDIERKNLTSNEFGAQYFHSGRSTVNYLTNYVNLLDIPRDRQRYNFALVTDYKLPEGKIKFTNFLSNGTTNVQQRSELFDLRVLSFNQHQYSLASTNSTSSTINNNLEFEDQIPIFHLDAKFSHTYSETKDPNDWTATFIQYNAGLGAFAPIENLNPLAIPKAANNNLAETNLNTFITNSSFARQRALSASLDLDANINISDYITANLKFGGKYRYQWRDFRSEQFDGQGLQLISGRVVDDLISSYFNLPSLGTTTLPIGYFTDPHFSYGKFLGGDYTMISPLNYGMLSQAADLLKRNVDFIIRNNGQIAYGRNNFQSTTFNYSGHEDQSAFYIMSVINVGPQITIIPGIRYQNLKTTYTAPRGIESQLAYFTYNHYDTTTVQSNGYWLPDVSVRYKPTSWCDLRLSYTNTVAYPDYNAIIPRIDVSLTGIIAYNNFELKPSRSRNYDAYLSFYENTIGLFTVGGFLKQIDNLLYPWSFYVLGGAASKYFPPSLVHNPPSGTYQVNTFVNDPYQINDYGAELDWQTHFWYLPGPLSGLVFNINHTHIFSKAQYPYTDQFKPNPRAATIFIDTFYVDHLLYQPNDIINLSLGFDYKGFSARVSMLYQRTFFTGNDYWPQTRTNTLAYRRWDLAVKQDLPWYDIQVYGDLNNINSAKDVSVIQAFTGVPNQQQDYGLTADLGVRIKL